MPTNSLVIINDMILNENADNKAQTKLPLIDINKIRLLPVVSARKPQKCELNTIPIYPTEFNKPCSVVDISISQRIYGITKPIFTFSTTTPIKPKPQTNNRNK